MHITIYFNSKPLFLCDRVDAYINEYLHHEDAVFIDELSSPAINSMIREMMLEKIHAGIYYHPSLDVLKKAFFKKFTILEAAGGLVINEKNEALLIHRLGKWDLPKGKMEQKESPEESCLREISEETGLNQLYITRQLPPTYHTYHQDTRFILKETHWFLVEGHSNEPLKPQKEEGIEDICWISPEQLPECLQNTYASIKDVFSSSGWGATPAND
ncbi:MAG: NUDIX domain-containing protein [Dinghuibacter sp.]|nr:NUDIX domain-containing protein [Dinghuibacter sp.]